MASELKMALQDGVFAPLTVVQANIVLLLETDDLLSQFSVYKLAGGVLRTWTIVAIVIGVVQIPYLIACYLCGHRSSDTKKQLMKIVFSIGETILITAAIFALVLPGKDDIPNSGRENRARYSLILFIIIYILITLYMLFNICNNIKKKQPRGNKSTLSASVGTRALAPAKEMQTFVTNSNTGDVENGPSSESDPSGLGGSTAEATAVNMDRAEVVERLMPTMPRINLIPTSGRLVSIPTNRSLFKTSYFDYDD